MHTLLSFFLVLLSLPLAAQDDCTRLFQWLSPNTTLTYTDYNRKGKEEGVSTMTVTALEPTAEGLEATLTIQYEDDEREAYNGGYQMLCTGDKILVDMTSMLSEEMLAGFGDVETQIEFDHLDIPATLTPGQRLQDGSLTMRATLSGGMAMTMNVRTENRQVTGAETITTPAGTFDTHRITYDQTVKMMMMNRSFRIVEYWNSEVGMVKSELYNKNDKLMSSHVLTGRK